MRFSRYWLWLLLLIPVGLGVARLRFDVEVLDLLPPELAVVQGLKIYQQNFSNARELILTIQGATPEEAEHAAQVLASAFRAQTNLVEYVFWKPPWMEHPDQAGELLAFLWLNQPPEIINQLANRLNPANLTNTLAEARERLATSMSPTDIALGGYDPYGLTRLPDSMTGAGSTFNGGEEFFASPDGTFRVIFVEAKTRIVSYKECRAWLQQIKEVVARERHTGRVIASTTIHFTGRPAFVTEIAGGMENDMGGSAGGTLATIGILFYLTHRRIRPLVWLLVILVLLLGATMAFGGLIFGRLNVVSIGFASILAGLAEDFGILLYQESRSHPELGQPELRHEAGPGIFWSAVTTAGAFLLLNLGGLPGLGQLGSLVAIGILLAAVVMVYGYLPLILRWRRAEDARKANPSERFLLFTPLRTLPPKITWYVTIGLAVFSIMMIIQYGIPVDRSPDPLRPKNSEAYGAVEQIKEMLGRNEEPIWVLVPGADEREVEQKLDDVNRWLSGVATNRLIANFTLPQMLWPRTTNQILNRPALAGLIQQEPVLREAAVEAGFAPHSLALTDNILKAWKTALSRTNVYWPANEASRWIFDKMVSQTTNGFLAIGLVYPSQSKEQTRKFFADIPAELKQKGVLVSGWSFLGPAVFELIAESLPRVLIPILLLVLISLWLAFRSIRDVLLSLAALVFSGLMLGAAMHMLHWDWNLLNLMALPLLLGMGVDFSIHMQLSLRRYQGDLMTVRRSVGRALLLAGATTVAGFASLSFSTNLGMASLGKVCALGIVSALVTAVYLLPVWWVTVWRTDLRKIHEVPH